MASGRERELLCENEYSKCLMILKYVIIPAINVEAEQSSENSRIFAGNTCESEWKLDHVKSVFRCYLRVL